MNELNIYGTSTKINLIEGVYSPSLGINRFPQYFPDVDYWFWPDNGDFGWTIYKNNKTIFTPYTDFEPGIDILGCVSSATFAIDWAYKMGCKKVNLYGILDDDYIERGQWILWNSFYSESPGWLPKKALESVQEFIDIWKDKLEITQPLKGTT